MILAKRCVAELVGTFWLVLGGCGSAVLSASFHNVGIGLLGVSLAFGLTVLSMAYAIGHISGCHLNPAVTVGLVTGGRFPAKELPHYVVMQVLGGILGAGVLYVIASGKGSFSLSGGFASNGFGEHSPGGYSMVSCLVAEVVLTFMFLVIILGGVSPLATHLPLATYLILACEGLESVSDRNKLTAIANDAKTPKSLKLDIQAINKLWGN